MTRPPVRGHPVRTPQGKAQGFGNSAITVGDRIYVSGPGGDIHALTPGSNELGRRPRLQRPRFFHRLLAADEKTLCWRWGRRRKARSPT